MLPLTFYLARKRELCEPEELGMSFKRRDQDGDGGCPPKTEDDDTGGEPSHKRLGSEFSNGMYVKGEGDGDGDGEGGCRRCPKRRFGPRCLDLKAPVEIKEECVQPDFKYGIQIDEQKHTSMGLMNDIMTAWRRKGAQCRLYLQECRLKDAKFGLFQASRQLGKQEVLVISSVEQVNDLLPVLKKNHEWNGLLAMISGLGEEQSIEIREAINRLGMGHRVLSSGNGNLDGHTSIRMYDTFVRMRQAEAQQKEKVDIYRKVKIGFVTELKNLCSELGKQDCVSISSIEEIEVLADVRKSSHWSGPIKIEYGEDKIRRRILVGRALVKKMEIYGGFF